MLTNVNNNLNVSQILFKEKIFFKDIKNKSDSKYFYNKKPNYISNKCFVIIK